MKKTTITFTVIMVSLLTAYSVHAKRVHHEKWYQEQWCQEQGGEMEVVLKDATRCDCITDTHAVEMDFADNWYAAVGQSSHYSLQTGKRAGIVLILESPDDKTHWERLINLVDKSELSIDVWAVGDGVDSEIPQPHKGENKQEEKGSDCQELPTIEMERTGSSVKWVVNIPCLIDNSGAFGKVPMWAIFGSKQREDGNLLFGVDDYGYVK
ncbi:hypothetical protein [Candidatus Parabeggiatoa sp. HSG14]|uniref:hypothetical protein n=1 Tax=Candidatus Parabeggiatoa sp. HSG14 TaxID=3055593 RepID=UPI0025A80D14|nr:hypothetical protein [Thiotrichales bacterium HSG14]